MRIYTVSTDVLQPQIDQGQDALASPIGPFSTYALSFKMNTTIHQDDTNTIEDGPNLTGSPEATKYRFSASIYKITDTSL